MARSRHVLRGLIALWQGGEAPKRRLKKSALAWETLENRVVLSSIGVGTGSGSGSGGTTTAPVQTGPGGSGSQQGPGGGTQMGPGGCSGSQQGSGGTQTGSGSTGTQTGTGSTGSQQGPQQGPGGSQQGPQQGPGGPGGGSSVLNQDNQKVQQAFQTFGSSYLAAAAALRQTATTTAGPSQAGLTTFDNAIAAAIKALDGSIDTDLSNLTNTGTDLAATIDGYTADLQAEVDSAATGLASSTNAAVNAMNQEVNTYIGSAQGQASSAILADAPAGTLTPTSNEVQTYNQAAQDAYSAFNTAISNAGQAAISSGAKLDTGAINAAISTLQSALTTAISGLGTAFTSSKYNPTSTITTDLNNLATALAAIAAPTAGNTASAKLFLQTVSATLSKYENQVNQAVMTAIQNYNNSLL